VRLTKGPSFLLAAGAILGALSPAAAKINPNFTPNDLIESSDQILVLRLKPADAKGLVHSVVGRTLKGDPPKKPPVIDLTITAHKEHAKAVAKMIPRLNASALLFMGKDEHGEEAAFLHAGGRWMRLDPGEKAGYWDMDQISAHMEGTWAGGTDMLLKIVELLLKHPEVAVPVDSGCTWAEQRKVGKIAGPVHDLQAVDLAGDGRRFLFVAASGGDRLFRYDPKAGLFADKTTASKLTTGSRAAAWGDFNADGRLDLASFDGNAVSLWLQTKGGTFSPPDKPIHKTADCLGLTALDVGGGTPGLLVSTSRVPVLLVPGKDGGFRPKSLEADPALAKSLGRFGRCLVADFDGDGRADVLQPATEGSRVYKGTGRGSFAPAVKAAVALGKGRSGAVVGDWDHDGRFDVFTAAADTCRLWHNQGRLTFHNMLGLSGEIAYISKPGAIDGGVCDVNNDGRQDVLITYPAILPQVFFNRGFRSFGHAHQLDLAGPAVAPGPAPEDAGPELNPDEEETLGEQTALIRDLDGDGAQDLIVVFRHHVRKRAKDGGQPGPWRPGPQHGEMWVHPRQVEDDAALSLRVALPPGRGFAGPITVTGWARDQCLGAWNVLPGTAEAFFGQPEAGPVEIRWQVPGGKPQRKIVLLEEKPVRVLIKPAK